MGGQYAAGDPVGTKGLIIHDYCRGTDLAKGHRQKMMTNTSWWGTYNSLASHVLFGRRKGCSGSILLRYLF